MSEEERIAFKVLCWIIDHNEDYDMAFGSKIQRPVSVGHEEMNKLKPLVPMILKHIEMIEMMSSQLTAPINDKDWVKKYYSELAESKLFLKTTHENLQKYINNKIEEEANKYREETNLA